MQADNLSSRAPTMLTHVCAHDALYALSGDPYCKLNFEGISHYFRKSLFIFHDVQYVVFVYLFFGISFDIVSAERNITEQKLRTFFRISEYPYTSTGNTNLHCRTLYTIKQYKTST